jgi:hypothetical protein
MEQLDQIIAMLALTMGVGWASGINLYATLLTLGVLANTGHMVLPEELAILADPMVMGAAGLMYMVEFTADKIPGIDTGWDSIHTFIRIPAGAVLAATIIGDMSPAVEMAAALVGGGLAATTHATKAGSRILINTSPEPFTNWTASIAEDFLVIAGLWTAIQNPWLFMILLVLFLLMLIWLLPKIWAGVKTVFRAIKRLFVKEDPVEQNAFFARLSDNRKQK